MTEIVRAVLSIETPFNMVVAVVIVMSLAGVVTSFLTAVTKQIARFAMHREEIEFKRELLDRGLAIDEIERVVRARTQGVQKDA
jgi:hypothetical protein